MMEWMTRRKGTALAIQGGGAHGAYAWGVLDALLERGFGFESVSGVSSGAITAVMASQGFVTGGTEGARRAMRAFWERVAHNDPFAAITDQLDRWLPGFELGRGVGGSIATQSMNALLGLFGAAAVNPLGQNPLRPILTDLVDPAALRQDSAPRLHIGATAVETGAARIFRNDEITVDALLASACLPMLFPAVEIDGIAYWDGAYSGNPPIVPLLADRPRDLVLIRAQSTMRQGVPTKPADIVSRIEEIAFQSVVEAELAHLPASVGLTEYSANATLSGLPPESRAKADRGFIETLFDAGRSAVALAEVA